MKKFLKKIGTFVMGVFLAIKAFVSKKVYADAIAPSLLNPQPDYGVISPRPMPLIALIAIIMIPVVIVIGLVVYLIKKHKK